MGKAGEASPHAEPTAKRLSKLTRSSTYRASCTAWFSPGHTKSFSSLWQAHHVACHHALAGRQIEPADKEYVEQCLWITEWDLNASDNLIGLPMNKQYRESDGLIPVNMPSHQVDHNTSRGYTDECKDWLKDNLWDTIRAGRDPHTTAPEDISATLESCSALFKGYLFVRGMRSGGTIAGWTNRFDAASEETWYHPFSMADEPSHRHPGVSAGVLTKLFKKIKLK